MVAKLAVIILAWAVMAASVLSLRQQRFETVKRMSLVKRELDRKERALWDRRASVASLTRPGELRETIARGGQEWTPILRATPGMAPPRPQTAIAKKDSARTAQGGRIRAANGN